MFMAAVTLSVAAIPEGSPAPVAITLAIAVHRMAKRHAFFRKIPGVRKTDSLLLLEFECNTGILIRD
jgi:magnesium-transporting ATPase (P-type)